MFITIDKYTADNIEHFKDEFNITEELDMGDTADPNKNYDKLTYFIQKAKEKYLNLKKKIKQM